jgi:hypothetical protein
MDLKTLKRSKDSDCVALVENFQRVDHNSATRPALFAAALSLARVALASRSARAARPAQRAASAARGLRQGPRGWRDLLSPKARATLP